MATLKTTNQTQKILNFLSSGQTLTETQAVKMFGIQRVQARVAELREAGYAIYTNTNKSGATTYRLGTPSRAMVGAAYASLGPKFIRITFTSPR
jgi:hypothetical protein